MNKDVKNDDTKCLLKSSVVSKPILTIAIPTYKRNLLLIEAIDSCLNQIPNNVNYEIIVVNNDPECFMDDIIEKYKKYNNISFYVNSKNLGMYGNMNKCFLLAKGDFIAYLHDDDLIYNNYLYEIEDLLANNLYGNKIAVINRNVTGFDNYGKHSLKIKYFNKLIKIIFCFRKLYKKDIEKLTVRKSILTWTNIYLSPTCGTIFNKRFLIDIDGFDENEYPCSDYLLYLRVNMNNKICLIRKKLGEYRWINNESLNTKTMYETKIKKINLLNHSYDDFFIDSFIKIFRNEIINTEIYDLDICNVENAINDLKICEYSKQNKLKKTIYNMLHYFFICIYNIDYIDYIENVK